MAKSRSPGLADEPMTTWPTGVPATSRTGTTLPGDDGLGDQRLELRQVDRVGDVVLGALLGDQLGEVVLAALAARGSAGPRRRPGTPWSSRPSSAPMLAMTWRSIAVSVASAGPVVLDDPVGAALGAVAAQHLEDDVLGRAPRRQLAGQLARPRSRASGWSAASPVIASATSRPPTPIASMPERAAGRGVRVGADHRLARACRSAACASGARRRCRAWSTRARSAGRPSAGRRGPRRSSRRPAAGCGRRTGPTPRCVTRSRPSASSSCITSVPVASWVRVWSIRRAISSPGVISPSTRWDAMSWWATPWGMRRPPEGSAAVAPRVPDQRGDAASGGRRVSARRQAGLAAAFVT